MANQSMFVRHMEEMVKSHEVMLTWRQMETNGFILEDYSISPDSLTYCIVGQLSMDLQNCLPGLPPYRVVVNTAGSSDLVMRLYDKDIALAVSAGVKNGNVFII